MPTASNFQMLSKLSKIVGKPSVLVGVFVFALLKGGTEPLLGVLFGGMLDALYEIDKSKQLLKAQLYLIGYCIYSCTLFAFITLDAYFLGVALFNLFHLFR